MIEGWDWALVLGGGNALGAFHLGAAEALLAPEAGLPGSAWPEPAWIVGASIGAVAAAILVGNPPALRLPRLREFWAAAAQPDLPGLGLWPTEARARWANLAGLSALLTGRPGLSAPRLPGLWSILPGMPPDQGLQDLSPLRRSLERLVDWDLLNRPPIRLSVVATDARTADEAWFDTRQGGVAIEHVLGSASLAPLFPPVEAGGRLLCDGGLRDNLPVARPFADPPPRPLLVVACDLYGLTPEPPASLDRAATRAQDLGFAAQARRGIEALGRERALLRRLDPGRPPAILAHLAYRPDPSERTLKALDFSRSALDRRAAQGRAAVATLREALPGAPRDEPLAVIRPHAR